MTELMQLRECVEGVVVQELQRQGELMATVLADLQEAGASKPEEEPRPKAEDEPPSADDRHTPNSGSVRGTSWGEP